MSLKISGDTKIHVLLRWADGFEDKVNVVERV